MQPKFATHKDARDAGWFSRRYQSNETHQKVQQADRERKTVKQSLVNEIVTQSNSLTLQQKLERVLAKEAHGIKCTKEKQRLTEKISK